MEKHLIIDEINKHKQTSLIKENNTTFISLISNLEDAENFCEFLKDSIKKNKIIYIEFIKEKKEDYL